MPLSTVAAPIRWRGTSLRERGSDGAMGFASRGGMDVSSRAAGLSYRRSPSKEDRQRGHVRLVEH